MLRKLTKILAEGQAHSQAKLARQLGVSEGLLTQMLEDLARRGYLEAVSLGSAGGCASCPLARRCTLTQKQPVKIWVLTEKGLKAAEKARTNEQ